MNKSFKLNKDVNLEAQAAYFSEATLDDPEMVENFSFFYCVLFLAVIFVI